MWHHKRNAIPQNWPTFVKTPQDRTTVVKWVHAWVPSHWRTLNKNYGTSYFSTYGQSLKLLFHKPICVQNYQFLPAPVFLEDCLYGAFYDDFCLVVPALNFHFSYRITYIRELISTCKMSHKHNNKDWSCLQ